MSIKKLHKIVWERFIRMPYGHLLDAADLNGDCFIPTAQECQNCIPNIMSYATAIADCAFFGGLYVYGLCEKYDRAPDAQTKKEIHILVDGLLLLCDIGKVDGFIARGVADDGITHYPTTTEDQVGPWLLGLWRTMHSSVADEALQEKIRPRLVRTLRGISGADWQIPIEWEDHKLKSFLHKTWRSSVLLLFCAALSRELGIIVPTEFEVLANSIPAGGIYNRLVIASNGFAGDMIHKAVFRQFWIHLPAQLALRELVSLDPAHTKLYKRGLAINGTAVIDFLRDFVDYNKEGLEFNHNWRVLIPEMQPWTTYDEAFTEAKRLNSLWGQYNPLRSVERNTIGQALFGAWIAVVSGDRAAADYAYKCLCEAAETVDWDKVGQSYSFTAEAAMYCYNNQ